MASLLFYFLYLQFFKWYMKSWDKRFCCISWRTLGQPRWWIVWLAKSLGSLWFAEIYSLVKASLVQWLKAHINQLRDFGLTILFIHSSPKIAKLFLCIPFLSLESPCKFWGLEMFRYYLIFYFGLSFLFPL